MDKNNEDKDLLNLIKENIENEPYAKLFGIKVLELLPGYSLVKVDVKKEYNNIFGIAHGGLVFSILDVAFGSAANSYGTVAVALNVNISYIKPAKEGDSLRAQADEIARSKKTAVFFIVVKNQEDEIIATAQAVAYLKKDKLPFLIDK